MAHTVTICGNTGNKPRLRNASTAGSGLRYATGRNLR